MSIASESKDPLHIIKSLSYLITQPLSVLKKKILEDFLYFAHFSDTCGRPSECAITSMVTKLWLAFGFNTFYCSKTNGWIDKRQHNLNFHSSVVLKLLQQSTRQKKKKNLKEKAFGIFCRTVCPLCTWPNCCAEML
jgi:hypothetical protein